MTKTLILLLLGTALLAPRPANGAQPPFGLNWDQPAEPLLRWSKTYTRRCYALQNLVILEVQGPFPQKTFHTLKFSFHNNKLCAVEIQYPPKTNHIEGLLEFMSLRNQLSRLLGNPPHPPQEHTDTHAPHTTWKLKRYLWNNLWLVCFQATHHPPKGPRKTYCLTSIHYWRP